MAKAQTYLKDIRAQVKADHGGKVPDHLNLTIRNYANALEIRDRYREEILADGVVIIDTNTSGFSTRKQRFKADNLFGERIDCKVFLEKEFGIEL